MKIKYNKCPHCGSKNGFEIIDVWVEGTASIKYTYTGEFEIYNQEIDIDDYCFYNTNIICIDCDEEICTYREMFKEE